MRNAAVMALMPTPFLQKRKSEEAVGIEDADVKAFLVGGTQTNSVVIDALLMGCEGALTNDTGHIGVHEAGAIEAFRT